MKQTISLDCGTEDDLLEVCYDSQAEKKEAFLRLEQLRKKGTVINYDAELASYRDERYGR